MLLAESWTLFIIGWLPFYSWLRLIFLLYLVLPQTQGAKVLYLDYLEPFIVHHESRIDDFITEAHQWLQQMGLGHINTVIDIIREKVLGQKSPQQPAPAQGYASYAQDLLSRFAMPQARTGAQGDPAAGLYGMVSGFAGANMAGRSRDPASEAAMIPDSLVKDVKGTSSSDKSKAIAAQRERLTGILKGLEAEQQNIDLAYGTGPGLNVSGLKAKSRSEQSFEKVDYDEAADDGHSSSPKQAGSRSSSGAWIPSGVTGLFSGSSSSGGQSGNKQSKGWSSARDITEAMAEGMSSGFDRNR